LICGYDEFWILEAKGVFNESVVEEIREKASNIYFNSFQMIIIILSMIYMVNF